MPRPTRAQIRRLLDDWGLPQVDPDSFFVGVFPESLMIAVDEVERLTAQDRGWTESAITTVTATNPAATSVIAKATPQPSLNEIVVIRAVAVDLVTANIEAVEINQQGTSGNNIIWQEGVSGGPALPAGRLIGGPNIQTTSFGTLLPIVLDGRDAQTLNLTIRIAVAAAITATLKVSAQVFQRPFVGFGT